MITVVHSGLGTGAGSPLRPLRQPECPARPAGELPGLRGAALSGPALAYPPEWPAVAEAVKMAAGKRCVRCWHRAESPLRRLPCDAGCDEHFHPEGLWLGQAPMFGRQFRRRKQRILTVHHLDGDKANLAWWNLPALCQVCHLLIQGKSRGTVLRIYADRRWLEREIWLLPYGLGWLAHQEGWALSQQAAHEGATRVVLEELVEQAELRA